MRTLDKKMFVNLGKVFLVGALAALPISAAGKGESGPGKSECRLKKGDPLYDLREAAGKKTISENCKNNSGVVINVKHKPDDKSEGACEGVYNHIEDSINDYDRKLDDYCENIKALQAMNKRCTGTNSNQKECDAEAAKLAAAGKDIQKGKQAAAENLANWIMKAKEKAQEAKEEIKSTGEEIKQTGQAEKAVVGGEAVNAPKDYHTAMIRKDKTSVPAHYMADTISDVSEALVKEQDRAIQQGEKAAQTLKAEAAKSAQNAQTYDRLSDATKKSGSNMSSIDQPKNSGSGKSEQASSGQGSGAGGGSGGGAGGGMPSPPGGGQGGESGAGSPMADSGANAPSTGNLSPNAVANKTDSSGKSTDLKLDTTPKKSATGDLSPSASGEILSGTGSSKLDTSLRDALKKKILGDSAEGGGSEALGGLGFGANGADPKKAGAPGAAAAVAGGGFSVPGFSDSGGGGDSGGGDFSMSRSETEAAVHNLLNEFGGTGANGADGRAIASTSDAEAGIEGMEGTSLIHRVHEAIVRRLKNGSVANGVNGKI